MALPPKYTGNEVCPKCGAIGEAVRYVFSDDCVKAGTHEHMHLSCPKCGYGVNAQKIDDVAVQWIALPMDAA